MEKMWPPAPGLRLELPSLHREKQFPRMSDANLSFYSILIFLRSRHDLIDGATYPGFNMGDDEFTVE